MLNNLTIKTVRTVTCDFSADQWELFTSTYARGEIQNIADNLNRYLMELVNNGYSRKDSEELMHTKMREFSKWGAYDSEPIRFLERVLDEVYKRPSL